MDVISFLSFLDVRQSPKGIGNMKLLRGPLLNEFTSCNIINVVLISYMRKLQLNMHFGNYL